MLKGTSLMNVPKYRRDGTSVHSNLTILRMVKARSSRLKRSVIFPPVAKAMPYEFACELVAFYTDEFAHR